MTDEHIRELNSLPQVIPNLLLGGALALDEVTADLDMGSVDDWDVRTILFDQRNETRHLWVINNNNVGSPSRKRAAFGEPIPCGIVANPMGQLGLTIFGQTNGFIRDTCLSAKHFKMIYLEGCYDCPW